MITARMNFKNSVRMRNRKLSFIGLITTYKLDLLTPIQKNLL